MWQFQWMLSLIPDSVLNWIYWSIIVLGISGIVASWLGRWIPFYGKYAGIIKPIGIILVVLGVWLRGGYDVEMAWRDRVAEMQKKVDAAEAASSAANRAIEVQVVTKTKVIKEKGQYIYQYIDREVVKDKEVIKFVENCPIPSVIIKTHNAAALNQPIEEKK
jgi:hypothetical protein